MLECKICGCKFNAIEERHYISRDNGKTGLAVAFGSTNEETLYDSLLTLLKKQKKLYAAIGRTNTVPLKTTLRQLPIFGPCIRA